MACRTVSMSRSRQGVMSEAGRAALSARMTASNPMSDPRTRAKVSAKLRQIGHKPSVRGGNGRGPTGPQCLLAEALGWPMEVAVPTGRGARAKGLPTHYKVDVGNAELKVAVEVDGGSHCSLSRREQDRRKTEWLTGAGWVVLRFTNREVLADVEACARKVRAAAVRPCG